MTPDEIRKLVGPGESETLELKKSTGERNEGAKAVCAMLNHRGGIVVFGATPEGAVVGQEVSDRTLERVSAEIQRIEPPAFPGLERHPVDETREVVLVRVVVGSMKPYTYKGDAYRRVGNTSLRMSREEYNRILFERMHTEERWENQPAPNWSVDDLDEEEIVITVEEAIRQGRLEDPGTRDVRALLRGLGLIREDRLLRAAIVLFGRREGIQAMMPQCLLRVARFRGAGRTEFLDNRQFHGNAFMLLRSAQRFMIDNLPVAGRVVPGLLERLDEPLYPTEALREALANAFCHRDYSLGGGSVSVGIYDDRLEVTSTGPLPFGQTPEQLFAPHESRPWNPLIAGVFYRRGIIEQWGRGTIKMAELTTAAGLPKPEIVSATDYVTVRFRPSRYVPPQRVSIDLTDRQQAILALLHQSNTGLARREIHAQLGREISDRTVQRDLNALRDYGMVIGTGRGRSAKWKLL